MKIMFFQHFLWKFIEQIIKNKLDTAASAWLGFANPRSI
jgi:hypothetical protein